MPILRIERRASGSAMPSDSLTLVYDQRKKSRLRVFTESGRDVAILLPRGSILRDGDLLEAEGGLILRIIAASESVSEARTQDGLLLARAAYHLGNRHVPLELGEGFVRYQHDHVLDAMVRDLGLAVTNEQQPFQPEGGAYAHAGDHGGHRHGHAHDQDHDHDHDPVEPRSRRPYVLVRER